MLPARLMERDRATGDGDLAPLVAPTKAPGDRGGPGLTIWSRFRRAREHVRGVCGHSIPTPTWRAVRFGAVGASIRGHDVSGTGWQTVGLIMLPTTTMTPMWQCGHARNDRPVSAS